MSVKRVDQERLTEPEMIFDFLTVLFFVSGLLLIYRMVRQRQRDILHGRYLQRREAISPARKPAMSPSAEGSATPDQCLSSMPPVPDEVLRMILDIQRDDDNPESR